VTLNADLQHLAGIINDTTGTYSQADKIAAYTTEYDTFLGSSLSKQSSPANADQRMQHAKFDTAIAGSEIGQAVIDGKEKLVAFQATQAAYAPDSQTKFYADLSDLQKQLPDFLLYGPDAVSRAQVKDEITLSATAQSLFRGTAKTAQQADAEQEAARLTAQAPQARQAAIDSTTLSPGLQSLVAIIYNAGGTSSAQDQVNAYEKATSAFGNLPKTAQQSAEDPFEISGGVSLSVEIASELQNVKFTQAVEWAPVVAAVDDAEKR
jgi:hypothetical protein